MNAKMKKILPPTLVLFCLIGMLVLHWIFPLASISNLKLVMVGSGFIGLGIMLATAAEGQFRRVGTNVNTFGLATILVTDGCFKCSRNPMYLSFALILIGAWITLGSLSPFLGIVAFIFVTDQWYIAYEERRLAETFGQAYEIYRKRTRRWL